MKNNHINKQNDIIDAEFFSEDDTKVKPSHQEADTDFKIGQITEYHYAKKEYNSEQNQSNRFQSFSYSFGRGAHLNLKKLSIFKLILFIPFFLVVLLFFLVIGLITLVIFLPKIFNVVRKKGISGLKMDYNLLRGLFAHFKLK